MSISHTGMHDLPQDVVEVIADIAVADVPTTLALRAVSSALRQAVDTRVRGLVVADGPHLDPWRRDGSESEPPPALILGPHLRSLLLALWESSFSPRPYRLAIVAFGLDGPKAPLSAEAAWCLPAGRRVSLGGVFHPSRVLARVPIHLQVTAGLAEHLSRTLPHQCISKRPPASPWVSRRNAKSWTAACSGLPVPPKDITRLAKTAASVEASRTWWVSEDPIYTLTATRQVLYNIAGPNVGDTDTADGAVVALDLAVLTPELRAFHLDTSCTSSAPFNPDVRVDISFPPSLIELTVHDDSAQGLVNLSLRRLLIRPPLRRVTFGTLRGLESLRPCAGTLESLTLRVPPDEADEVALTDLLADVVRVLESLVLLDVGAHPSRGNAAPLPRRTSAFATPSPALACLSCVADGRHRRMEHVYCAGLGAVAFEHLSLRCPRLLLLRVMNLEDAEVKRITAAGSLWQAHRQAEGEPWFVSPRYARDSLSL